MSTGRISAAVRLRIGAGLLVALVSAIVAPAISPAQDFVVIASATNPAVRTKKPGQILEYTGTELKLRTALGTIETIPAARIAEVETTWTPAHQTALAARAEGRLDDAIAAFRQAKRDEPRPWGVRQVMAELTTCYLETGAIDLAGDEFLGILASDPRTPHFAVIPAAWRGMAIGPAVEARATAWLSSRATPAAIVLGASWLLATRRGEATAALSELAKSSDPRIAGLATIELWRIQLITATPDDARRWQTQLEAMPTEVQAAGWYVLGDTFARQDNPPAAAIAYLKIPILFRRQRAMSAEALLAAGGQLGKMTPAADAARLYRELMREFPQAAAATEARSRLEKLSPIKSAP